MPGDDGASTYRSALSQAAAKSGVEADASAVKTDTEEQPVQPVTKGSKPTPAAKSDDGKAVPYHPLLADMDLDDVPDDLKAKLLDKVKRYDRAFQKESSAYATYKRFQSLYASNAAFAKDVDTAVSRHTGNGTSESTDRESRSNESTPTSKSGALKYLDQQLEAAKTPEEREAIRDARRAITDETAEYRDAITSLKAELKELKQELGSFRSERIASREATLEKELEALEESFSSSLIDKYREELSTWAKKYPTRDARWLLYKIADPDELDEARVTPKAAPSKPGPKPGTKRPAPSVTPSGTETLDERFKTGPDRSRRWNLGQTFRHLASSKAANRS